MKLNISIPILLVIVTSTAAFGQVAPLELRNDRHLVASLEFYVVGTYWKPVAYHIESFRPVRDPSVELSSNFVGLQIQHILIGEYNYVLIPEGGATRSLSAKKGIVWVRPGDNWITVLAPQYPAGDSAGTLSGMIFPMQNGRDPIWVRVQSPYEGEEFVQARVDEHGRFTLPLRAPGNYIVIVCRGEDVMLAKPFHRTVEMLLDHYVSTFKEIRSKYRTKRIRPFFLGTKWGGLLLGGHKTLLTRRFVVNTSVQYFVATVQHGKARTRRPGDIRVADTDFSATPFGGGKF